MKRIAFSTLILLSVAACGDMDPYRREGMWQPEGVAYGNLAAEVANPHDLVVGQSNDGYYSGDRAAKAIEKWVKQGPGGSPSLSSTAGGYTAGTGGAASSGGSSGSTGGTGGS